ncbi:MAG: WG repeat-containing protein, partial [Deltaproteobacteria bacterium]|nr:WG repeat-containing protein [Deltaproteobacteria bacterium]
MEGEWVIPPNFRRIHSFDDNRLAPAQDDNEKWGFINMEGEWVIPPNFSDIHSF